MVCSLPSASWTFAFLLQMHVYCPHFGHSSGGDFFAHAGSLTADRARLRRALFADTEVLAAFRTGFRFFRLAIPLRIAELKPGAFPLLGVSPGGRSSGC